MPTIHFVKEGRKIEVEKGTNLREAAREAGVSVYQGPAKFINCLGNGICGTCLVFVEDGIENCSEIGFVESANLSFHPLTIMHASERPDLARLSCQTSVYGDIKVDTEAKINLYGNIDHEYANKLKGERFVEFPENAPRGVNERKEREEEGKAKDWYHQEREVKVKSNSVDVEETSDTEEE